MVNTLKNAEFDCQPTLPQVAPTLRDTVPAGATVAIAKAEAEEAAAMAAQADSALLTTAPGDRHIGRVLGNLRIVRKLAEGGMGSVYLAHEEGTGRTAAIKILLPQFTKNRAVVQRFFNEAKAAQAIGHPSVVKIYGADYDESGHAYIVMEHLEGESLARRIKDRGRLSVTESLDIARQILIALSAAHERGIVHRDLKPGNIFMVRDPEAPGGERVKLLDFGVAKLTAESPLTCIGDVIGTPLYMAPEQCRANNTVDHRADIYALGCLLYAMTSGRPPFSGNYPGDIICAHLQAPVPPLRMFLPEIPPAIDALVLLLLKKDPAKRPQSAHAVLELLDNPTAIGALASAPAPNAVAAVGTGKISSQNPAPAPRRPAWHRMAIIGAAGILATLVGVLMLTAL